MKVEAEVQFATQVVFHVNKSIETSNNCSNGNVNHEISHLLLSLFPLHYAVMHN